MKTLLRLSIVLGFAAVFAVRAVANVQVGETAPDFKLTDLGGQSHALSDFRGKTVVLEWNNPDCPIVRKHYESDNLPKLQRDATADGIVWLLINSGAAGQQGADYSPAEFTRWLDEHHAKPTAYLRDRDGKVGRTYGAKTTPHMYIIDPKGVLVYQGAIDSIPSSKTSDIPKATNYVRTALAAMKEGKPVEPTATKPYGCSVKY